MKWIPGMLPPSLSWTHYRTLLRVNINHCLQPAGYAGG